uniref:Uncharacterized protein n=1 Tax=Setaria italica TaxID=4555 RepID=K4AMD7_SETIT
MPFFGWLVIHGRCWTSNRLRRHGLRDRDDCALCARETWFRILSYIGMPRLTLQVEITFAKWWIQAWKTVTKIRRKGFDSLIWLVAWSIWKERRRVHERLALQPVALASVILEQARLWKPAGFVSLASVLRPKLR